MREDFAIDGLGPCRIPSPLECSFFLPPDAGILLDATVSGCVNCEGKPVALEAAGPRREIFFDPAKTRAAIVTCGGLCPGLNDVIRALTMILWYRYGVRNILGLKYGYEGLNPAFRHKPVALDPDIVADIHQNGGTILGTSRGDQDVGTMVDFLVDCRIDILFTVGGDGTQRGALEITREIGKRKLPIAVVGLPKTIDNDIQFTERTFGFETATEMTQVPIRAAHMEAKSVLNGIGLVKLMGRESGFVAAYATLASSDVNLCLIPEAPFKLEKVLAFLEARLTRKSHAVIVVAEGAGQDLVSAEGKDDSGNRKLGDIGVFLKGAFTRHFKSIGMPASVKYIDPSYTIRSAPASADDSVFCFRLGEHAVHAAMAGRTGMMVAIWNGHFVHVPMAQAISERKKVDPNGSLWLSVLDNTGQPASLA